MCWSEKKGYNEYENNVSHQQRIENMYRYRNGFDTKIAYSERNNFALTFLPFVINQIKLIVRCTGKLPLLCAHTGLGIECVTTTTTTTTNDMKTITFDRKQRESNSATQQSNDDVFLLFLLSSFSVSLLSCVLLWIRLYLSRCVNVYASNCRIVVRNIKWKMDKQNEKTKSK